MIIRKPDGVIEFGMSGCCCPPGQRRDGLHTNSTTSWFRVNGGEWKSSRVSRNTLNEMTLARAADTVEEFLMEVENL